MSAALAVPAGYEDVPSAAGTGDPGIVAPEAKGRNTLRPPETVECPPQPQPHQQHGRQQGGRRQGDDQDVEHAVNCGGHRQGGPQPQPSGPPPFLRLHTQAVTPEAAEYDVRQRADRGAANHHFGAEGQDVDEVLQRGETQAGRRRVHQPVPRFVEVERAVGSQPHRQKLAQLLGRPHHEQHRSGRRRQVRSCGDFNILQKGKLQGRSRQGGQHTQKESKGQQPPGFGAVGAAPDEEPEPEQPRSKGEQGVTQQFQAVAAAPLPLDYHGVANQVVQRPLVLSERHHKVSGKQDQRRQEGRPISGECAAWAKPGTVGPQHI